MLTSAACLLTVLGVSLGPAELQGTWKLVSIEGNGKAIPLAGGQPRWTIQGDKIRYGNDDIATLTSDDTSTPKTIDLAFFSPNRMVEGIYSVEGDTLKVCFNKRPDGVKERPLVFSTNGKEGWRLLVFRRDKAAEIDENEGLHGYVGVALRLEQGTLGLIVDNVLDNSPAKKAGLRKGDVVLDIAGNPVTKLRPAVETIRSAKPGSKLPIHIQRDGKEEDVTVQVGVLPFAFLVELE